MILSYRWVIRARIKGPKGRNRMNASPGVVVEATDDVDHLVDELVKDPSRADDIKAVLKQRISKPQPVIFTS